MGAEALHLAGVRAAVREEARPVCFQVTKRLDVRLLNWWQRAAYRLLVRALRPRLPPSLRVPPVPPEDLGGFLSFAEADAACTTRDHQIHVLPLGWTHPDDEIQPDVSCRPRDPSDSGRYLLLRERYGDEEEYAARDGLAEVVSGLEKLRATLGSV